MTRRLVIAFALWIFAVFPLRAETVEVRSGEHDDFTRLVLSVPRGSMWDLGRSGKDYVFRLDRVDTTYDLRRAFERIPRDRIGSLTDEGEGSLNINLVCDPCHAEAFVFRGDLVVVDIIDGPPAEDSLFETPIGYELVQDIPPGQTAESPFAFREEAAEMRSAEIDLGAAVSSLDDHLRAAANSQVAINEQALTASIARAASQGLLTLAVPLEGVVPRAEPGPLDIARSTMPYSAALDAVERPELNADASEALATEARQPSIASPGIEAHTSLDEAFGLEVVMGSLATGHQECMESDTFDLAAWAPNGSDFATVISARRSELTTAADRVDEDAVLALARAYIHFGFGLEARMILAQDGKQSHARLLLSELARVVDGEPVKTGLLGSQAACGTAGALWAILSDSAGPRDVDRNTVLRAFLQLPSNLKAHLGPALAEDFLASNDLETAGMILDSASGADVIADPKNTVVHEDYRAALDDAGLGQATRGAAVIAPPRPTPQAVIQSLSRALEAGRTPRSRDIELAESFRFEYEGDPIVAELAEVEIRAHAATGSYDTALALTAETASAIGRDRKRALQGAVVAMMVEELGDRDFLERVYSGLPADLPAETENLAAARLLALGFPEKAMELLSGEAMREAAAERRYLRAEAAIMLKDGRSALNSLLGVNDVRAAALRAEAYALLGDHEAAFSARAMAEIATGDPLEAWRAEAWNRLAASDDPLFRDLSDEILRTPLPGATAPVETLSEARDYLQSAERSQAMIEEMLDRFRLDADLPSN